MCELLRCSVVSATDQEYVKVPTMVLICTGTKLDLLLLNNMEHIIGAALPYQETGDPQDKTLAATVLTGGILAKHVSGS